MQSMTQQSLAGMTASRQEQSVGLAEAKVMSGLNLKKVTILAQQNPFVVSMIEPFKTEMAKRGRQVLDIVHKEPPRPVA